MGIGTIETTDLWGLDTTTIVEGIEQGKHIAAALT
jgi:hypothetical protein